MPTETLLQNHLEDLFHLLNFLNKHKLNDLIAFLNEIADSNKEDQVNSAHYSSIKLMIDHISVKVKSIFKLFQLVLFLKF